jgi:hypothetical protein
MRNNTRKVTSDKPNAKSAKRIHPIVIYPYSHPTDTCHLEVLYGGLIKDMKEPKYARPITVLSGDTRYRFGPWADQGEFKARCESFQNFLQEYVEKYSTAIHAWSVDTCQRWLAGFGKAFEAGSPGDVYWLIPADFNYATENGQRVLSLLPQIADKVSDGECALCLGEISVPTNSSKQLIDSYGTYGLLYNWFPVEAQGIRKRTEKPRTEFFAIDHDYLRRVLSDRWYPYEQTLIILLKGMNGFQEAIPIRKIGLGPITDEEAGRDNLANAMQQVERMERLLKLYWRDQQILRGVQGWQSEFRRKDAQSEQIRGAAMVILEQILKT